MDIIFKEIRDAILAKVPAIRWVDMNEAQLEAFGQDAPVDYPCVLIDFPEARYSDTGQRQQLAEVVVSVRVAFRVYERFNALVPTSFQSAAFEHLAVIKQLGAALHGLKGEQRSPLVRRTLRKNRESIDPKVYELSFECVKKDSDVGRTDSRMGVPLNVIPSMN